jgi:flagellar protein FliO/FliZ
MSIAWTLADWLQYILSFALVIGLLLALLWTLRRLQNGSSFLRKNTQRLQTLETLSIGPRQKVVLIRLDGQEVLIGVTAHQMTALTPWSSNPGQPVRFQLPTDLASDHPGAQAPKETQTP